MGGAAQYLRWLLLVPITVFPYGALLLLYSHLEQFWSILCAMWLAGLACALAAIFLRQRWEPETLALGTMLVKLVQIPAYVLWFIFAVVAFLFGGAVVAFFFDALTIPLSGILGLAAVLRNRRAGRLTTAQAVGYGILQFMFCADIIAAILVYCQSRKHKEETV